MTDYWITDRWTSRSEWVTAKNVTDALIIRENELRATNGRNPKHPVYGLPLLPATARPRDYSTGETILVILETVQCCGQRKNVVRS